MKKRLKPKRKTLLENYFNTLIILDDYPLLESKHIHGLH